jgi:hypothetical protein
VKTLRVCVGNIIGQHGRARYGTDGQGLGNLGGRASDLGPWTSGFRPQTSGFRERVEILRLRLSFSLRAKDNPRPR